MSNLDEIFADLRAMEQLLSAEREALAERDIEALEDCSRAKAQLCQHLQTELNRAGFRDGFAVDANVDADHKALFDLAEQVRESNLVNGKILARSQQFVREAITVLSGKSLDGLYGHSGQHTEQTDAGHAIARA